MSEPVQVTHFVDPGCPWDYSAEPVRVALEVRYGEQLAWRNVQVGVAESGATLASRGYTTAGLADSYRILGERYGMPFCTEQRPRLAGTWPAARAVKAAERQALSLGAALLRRLRLAWFVEARIVDERDELVRLATQVVGLDLAAFTAELERETSTRALKRDMAEARRPDPVALGLEKASHPAGEPGPRYSTPTYRFDFEGRSAVVPGFQPLAAYVVALQPSPRHRAPAASGRRGPASRTSGRAVRHGRGRGSDRPLRAQGRRAARGSARQWRRAARGRRRAGAVVLGPTGVRAALSHLAPPRRAARAGARRVDATLAVGGAKTARVPTGRWYLISNRTTNRAPGLTSDHVKRKEHR